MAVYRFECNMFMMTLQSATLEVVELITIGFYGSTVFGVVGFIIINDCFLLTEGIVT